LNADRLDGVAVTDGKHVALKKDHLFVEKGGGYRKGAVAELLRDNAEVDGDDIEGAEGVKDAG